MGEKVMFMNRMDCTIVEGKGKQWGILVIR